MEVLAASMKEMICSSRGLEGQVRLWEAEAVLESFTEDFVAFELHVYFSDNFCCV